MRDIKYRHMEWKGHQIQGHQIQAHGMKGHKKKKAFVTRAAVNLSLKDILIYHESSKKLYTYSEFQLA